MPSELTRPRFIEHIARFRIHPAAGIQAVSVAACVMLTAATCLLRAAEGDDSNRELAELLHLGLSHTAIQADLDSVLDVTLDEELQYRRTLSATLVLSSSGRVFIAFQEKLAGVTVASTLEFSPGRFIIINHTDKTYIRAQVSTLTKLSELFLEATPACELPSFPWWSGRVGGEEFVRAFDSVRFSGTENVGGVICRVYRLECDRGVNAELAVAEDGIPRRWTVNGKKLLSASLLDDPRVSVIRRETWKNVRFISNESFPSSRFDPGKANYAALEDYLLGEPVAARRLRGGNNPKWELPLLPPDRKGDISAQPKFSPSSESGGCVIIFTASWSLGARRSLPFYAAVETWMEDLKAGRTPVKEDEAADENAGVRENAGGDAGKVRKWLEDSGGPGTDVLLDNLAAALSETSVRPRIVLVWLDEPAFVHDLLDRLFPAAKTADSGSGAGAGGSPPTDSKPVPHGSASGRGGKPGGPDKSGEEKSPHLKRLDVILDKLAAESALFPFPSGIVSVVDADYSVRDKYFISELPAVFFVGGDGRISEVLLGPAAHSETRREFLKILAGFIAGKRGR